LASRRLSRGGTAANRLVAVIDALTPADTGTLIDHKRLRILF